MPDFFGTTIEEQVCEPCSTTAICADPLSPDCPEPPAVAIALSVEPASGQTDVGADFTFRAFAEFEDGRIREVTDEAEWSSSGPSIAESRGLGVFTAKQIGAIEGTATWGGLHATGNLRIVSACRDIPIDVVLCIETSAWMTEDVWRAARQMAYALRLSGKDWPDPRPNLDRIAVIKFAQNPVLATGFVSFIPFDALKVDGFTASPRVAPGRALAYARDLLHQNARLNARKLVVIVMSGLETDCGAPVRDMAALMKSESILIAAIGGRPKPRSVRGWNGNVTIINQDWSMDCSFPGTTIPATELVTQTASPNLAFLAETVGDISSVMSQIPSGTCGNFDGTGMPIYDPDLDPDDPGGPIPPTLPQCRDGWETGLFFSQYAWAVDPDVNPNSVLSPEQLSGALCLFNNELQNHLAATRETYGHAEIAGAVRWYAYTSTSSSAYKGISKPTCDPNDGIGDVLAGVGQLQVLSVPVCAPTTPL